MRILLLLTYSGSVVKLLLQTSDDLLVNGSLIDQLFTQSIDVIFVHVVHQSILTVHRHAV